jgi:hypothetical protein
LDDRRDYGEDRYVVYGEARNEVIVLVYTWRGFKETRAQRTRRARLSPPFSHSFDAAPGGLCARQEDYQCEKSNQKRTRGVLLGDLLVLSDP